MEGSKGNKKTLNAIIIKAEGDEASKSILEDNFTEYDGLIEPPYHLLTLCMLRENSTELGQCVDAMITNIEGFGYRLAHRPNVDETLPEVKAERNLIKTFLNNVNFDQCITSLRQETRLDIEDCGNSYWEFIPFQNKEGISSINKLESHQIRLGILDKEFTLVNLKYYNEVSGKVEEKPFKKRFRRFVQKVNDKKVYFKEWGDPRDINSRTGEVVLPEELDEAKSKSLLANPVFHFKIKSNRTPYGLPRYIGNLFSIYGSRSADEINFVTFENNNIPSMIVMVSNGALTSGSVKRVKEFVDNHVKGGKNRSSFLILEAEPADEDVINPGTMKMDIKDLSNAQKDDQLFQNYDANNSDKLRRCFRLPQIFVGKTDTLNRSVAQESRKLADEQIFGPERNKMDAIINRILIHEFNMQYHTFVSNSANVTNDEDLVKILSGGEKTGGVTPNLAREVLGDILNKEIPPYNEDEIDFDPNVPMSYTLVNMSSVVGGNENSGKIAPNQGQIPKLDIDELDDEEISEEDKDVVEKLNESLSESIVNDILKGLK